MLSVILPLTFAIIAPIQDTAKPTAYKPNPDAVRARDGASFSYRSFHDALLSRGSIPVLLAANLMLAED